MAKNNITDKELLEAWKKELTPRQKAVETMKAKIYTSPARDAQYKTLVEDFAKIEKAMQGVRYD